MIQYQQLGIIVFEDSMPQFRLQMLYDDVSNKAGIKDVRSSTE
jgi:hypothetical protein